MNENEKQITKVILHEKFLPRADVVFSVMFFHKELFEKTIEVITEESIEVVGLEQEAKNDMKQALLNSIYFDMKATTTDGSIVTLDLQRRYQKERIRNRIVYYACRELGNQYVVKSKYEDLQHVVVTFLLTEAPANSTVDCREIVLVDKKTNEIYTDIFRIFEVSISQISNQDKKDMQILRDFFQICEQTQMDDFVQKYGDTEYGILLLQQYMHAVSEPKFLTNLEKEEKYMIRLTEEDRMMERAEGKAEGRVEERKELQEEIVLRMHDGNYDMKSIKDITLLSEEEIKSILLKHHKNI